MKKWLCTITLIVFLFVAMGCEGESVPEEDWDQFDDIYEGTGPSEDFELMLVKLNFEQDGDCWGEMSGPFFAHVDGQYIQSETEIRVHLKSSFLSDQCFGMTLVEFQGTIIGDELAGVLQYSGCQLYEFYYLGVRVGGNGR